MFSGEPNCYLSIRSKGIINAENRYIKNPFGFQNEHSIIQQSSRAYVYCLHCVVEFDILMNCAPVMSRISRLPPFLSLKPPVAEMANVILNQLSQRPRVFVQRKEYVVCVCVCVWKGGVSGGGGGEVVTTEHSKSNESKKLVSKCSS